MCDVNSPQGRISWEGDKNLKELKEKAVQTSNVLGQGTASANNWSLTEQQGGQCGRSRMNAEEGSRSDQGGAPKTDRGAVCRSL